MPTFIHLQVDGEALPGYPGPNSNIGNVDLGEHTQVVSVYHDLNRPQGSHSSGILSVGPVTIVKLQDGISPLLLQAIHRNSSVNAQIKFFDLHPQTGQPREAYQLTLLNSRIVGLRTELQPSAGANDPGLALERVSILPSGIRHRSLIGNTEYEFTSAPSA